MIKRIITLLALLTTITGLSACGGVEFEPQSASNLGDKPSPRDPEPGTDLSNEIDDDEDTNDVGGIGDGAPVADIVQDPTLMEDLECCLSGGSKGVELCAPGAAAPAGSKMRSGGRLCVPIDALESFAQANPTAVGGRCL